MPLTHSSAEASWEPPTKTIKTLRVQPRLPISQSTLLSLVLRTHLATACGRNKSFTYMMWVGRGGRCRGSPLQMSRYAERAIVSGGRAGGKPFYPQGPAPPITPAGLNFCVSPIKKHPLSSVWKPLQGKFAAQSWLLTRVLIRGFSRLHGETMSL